MAVSASQPQTGGRTRNEPVRRRKDRSPSLFARATTGVVIALGLLWLVPIAWALDTSVKSENDTIRMTMNRINEAAEA